MIVLQLEIACEIMVVRTFGVPCDSLLITTGRSRRPGNFRV